MNVHSTRNSQQGCDTLPRTVIERLCFEIEIASVPNDAAGLLLPQGLSFFGLTGAEMSQPGAYGLGTAEAAKDGIMTEMIGPEAGGSQPSMVLAGFSQGAQFGVMPDLLSASQDLIAMIRQSQNAPEPLLFGSQTFLCPSQQPQHDSQDNNPFTAVLKGGGVGPSSSSAAPVMPSLGPQTHNVPLFTGFAGASGLGFPYGVPQDALPKPMHPSMLKPEHKNSRATRRGPMDEMRQLVRIMVKLMPSSQCFLSVVDEGGGGNRVSEDQIRAYIKATLGDGRDGGPPQPEWGLPNGWGAYLAGGWGGVDACVWGGGGGGAASTHVEGP